VIFIWKPNKILKDNYRTLAKNCYAHAETIYWSRQFSSPPQLLFLATRLNCTSAFLNKTDLTFSKYEWQTV